MWASIGTLFLLYCNHRDGKHRSPTTRKEEITMKNNTPRIDRDKKTLYATKSFLIKAGQSGTTEFNTLNNALKEHPGFKVEEEKIFSVLHWTAASAGTRWKDIATRWRNSVSRIVPNMSSLVRMRSPVRIWLSAPQKSPSDIDMYPVFWTPVQNWIIKIPSWMLPWTWREASILF